MASALVFASHLMFFDIILSWPECSADWVALMFKLSRLSSYMNSFILAKIWANSISCSKSPGGLDVEGGSNSFLPYSPECLASSPRSDSGLS